jgi:putative addiction module killer protein
MMNRIKIYETEPGEGPYHEWYASLTEDGRRSVDARLSRVALGHLGDEHDLYEAVRGVRELRFKVGYRIYYTRIERTILILLAGSTKQDQDRVIKKLKGYLKHAREIHHG